MKNDLKIKVREIIAAQKKSQLNILPFKKDKDSLKNESKNDYISNLEKVFKNKKLPFNLKNHLESISKKTKNPKMLEDLYDSFLLNELDEHQKTMILSNITENKNLSKKLIKKIILDIFKKKDYDKFYVTNLIDNTSLDNDDLVYLLRKFTSLGKGLTVQRILSNPKLDKKFRDEFIHSSGNFGIKKRLLMNTKDKKTIEDIYNSMVKENDLDKTLTEDIIKHPNTPIWILKDISKNKKDKELSLEAIMRMDELEAA
jgi:hypothetical protein